MPLSCLSEVADPYLFDEILYMAFQYGAHVAEKYVDALITNRAVSGNSSFIDRKPKGYWKKHILDRLANANGRSLIYKDFADGLHRAERYGLKESLRVLCKRGIVLKEGTSRRNFQYRLK